MDVRPIILPQYEWQTRKARELKARGYSVTAIAAAMGLRKSQVEDLLPTVKRKAADKARAKP
jgi:hypothetical protein